MLESPEKYRPRAGQLDVAVLFGSRGFDHVKRFVWRTPVASPAELAELRALRPKNLAIKIVHSNAEWVR